MSSNKEFTEAELCDLLDSTLDDFCRKEESLSTNNNESKSQASGIESPVKTFQNTKTPTNTPNIASPSVDNTSPADLFEIFESDPQLRENWSKIIKSCYDDSANFDDLDFQQSLQQTLKLVAEKAKEVTQSDGPSDEEFLNILKNFDEMKDFDGQLPGDPGSQSANMLPVMTDIMQNLISKEFLYPTLSDFRAKFPDYLQQNKGKISEEDYKRYEAQYEIVKKICAEYELEKDSDSDSVKQARFQRVLVHMQNMQEHGGPPADFMSLPDLTSSSSSSANPFGLFEPSSLEQSGCCLM